MENAEEGRVRRCPIVYALGVIGSKWKMPIVYQLTLEDGLHYNELRRRLQGGITNTTLTRALRELEAEGLVERRSAGSVPPSVTYHLTDQSRGLAPVFDALYAWGEGHMRASGVSEWV